MNTGLDSPVDPVQNSLQEFSSMQPTDRGITVRLKTKLGEGETRNPLLPQLDWHNLQRQSYDSGASDLLTGKILSNNIDALYSSKLANAKGMPVLLINKEQREFFKNNNIEPRNVTVIEVSKDHLSKVRRMSRISHDMTIRSSSVIDTKRTSFEADNLLLPPHVTGDTWAMNNTRMRYRNQYSQRQKKTGIPGTRNTTQMQFFSTRNRDRADFDVTARSSVKSIMNDSINVILGNRSAMS